MSETINFIGTSDSYHVIGYQNGSTYVFPTGSPTPTESSTGGIPMAYFTYNSSWSGEYQITQITLPVGVGENGVHYESPPGIGEPVDCNGSYANIKFVLYNYSTGQNYVSEQKTITNTVGVTNGRPYRPSQDGEGTGMIYQTFIFPTPAKLNAGETLWISTAILQESGSSRIIQSQESYASGGPTNAFVWDRDSITALAEPAFNPSGCWKFSTSDNSWHKVKPAYKWNSHTSQWEPLENIYQFQNGAWTKLN